MKKKTKTAARVGCSLQRSVRQHISVSQIDSMLFECCGAVLQYCNRYISVWIDGDTSHEPDIELSVDVLNRIAKVGDEQVHDTADAA